MANTRSYIGFSTIDAGTRRSWVYTDVELVKIDLLNHFNTRIGERVMRPQFGCRIWDYLFLPLVGANVEDVRADAKRIVESDSRVELINLNVIEFEHGIRVEMTLNFIGMSVIDTFTAVFEQGEANAFFLRN